jgi:hypothetical protein
MWRPVRTFEERLHLLRDMDAHRGVDGLVHAVLEHTGRRERDDLTILVAEVASERPRQHSGSNN